MPVYLTTLPKAYQNGDDKYACMHRGDPSILGRH